MYIVTPVLKTSRRLILWNIVRYTFPNKAVCQNLHTTFFSRVTKFHSLRNFGKKYPCFLGVEPLRPCFPFFVIHFLKYIFFYVVIRGLKPPLLLVVRSLKKLCVLPTYYNLRTLSIVEKNTPIMKCIEACSLEEKKEL